MEQLINNILEQEWFLIITRDIDFDGTPCISAILQNDYTNSGVSSQGNTALEALQKAWAEIQVMRQ